MVERIIGLVRNPTDDLLHEFEGEHGVLLGRPGLTGSRYHLEYTQELLEQFVEYLDDKCDGLALDYSMERGVVQIACLGRSSRVKAKRNNRICYDLLRALNAMLVDKYEFRSMTYRKDEPGFRTFVLAECGAWKEAERLEDLSNQFEKIGPNSGFLLDRYPWLVALSLERLGYMLGWLLATIIVRIVVRRR